MALDPMFMDFGLNLTKQYMAGRETDVANAGIALNNEIAALNESESQGYAAVNYSQSLEELSNANLRVSIQQMEAEAEARLASAAFGVSEEAQTFNIAREAGQTKAEIEAAETFTALNYKQERRAIRANQQSQTKIAIAKPSSLSNVVTAGADTYFRALKSGLIS
ncbi:hypothetical protein VPH526E571_0052 [Vibrio phage 526E57-1]